MSPSVFFTESSRSIGGQELQMLQQARLLQQEGWSVRVLCRPGGRVEEAAHRVPLPVERIRFRNALDLTSAGAVLRLVRDHRPCAIVCHSGHDADLCGLVVRAGHALGLLPHRPRLLRMRTYQAGPARPFSYNRLFDATFTPSAALRAELLRTGRIRADKVKVLYPGVDFGAIASKAGAGLPPQLQARLAGRRPLIVQAAMLRPEKGHRFLLRVIAQLVPRFPELLYVAAGEGPLLAELEAQVQREGLAGHVLLPGLLGSAMPLIRHADVLVAPSTYEPLGLAPVEALAVGVPVVLSKAGGLPETVPEGYGGLCPSPDEPGAEQDWVRVISAVLLDPSRTRAEAARAAEFIRERFDPAANLQALSDACTAGA